ARRGHQSGVDPLTVSAANQACHDRRFMLILARDEPDRQRAEGATLRVQGERSETLKIRRLEITGFKSFADRVVFSFDDGVTGVVGPNGCGKSNVVDAIRW